MSSTSSLRSDALGLPALFLCIATAAAPMTALLFNVPIIVSGAGWAAPAAFLVAAAMLAVFSIGYAQMSGASARPAASTPSSRPASAGRWGSAQPPS